MLHRRNFLAGGLGGLATLAGAGNAEALSGAQTLALLGGVSILPYRLNRVVMGLDSLTDGAGSTAPTTYGVPFAATLRAARGDAGFGPTSMADGKLASFSHGSTMLAAAALNSGGGSTAWTDPTKLKSITGEGYYCLSGNGSTSYVQYNQNVNDAFSRGSTQTVTSAKVYFIGLTTGWKIQIRQSDQNINSSMVVNEAGGFSTGVPQVVTYNYNPANNQNLQIIATGDVYVGMVEPNNVGTGCTLADIGLGGIAVSEWAQLDDATQRLWWSLIAPDTFVLICGTNDRTFLSASAYGTAVTTVLNRFPATTRPVLIRPNDTSDWATTNLKDYGPVLQSIASQRRCLYLDSRDVLGNYATAAANGDMYDLIHPSAQGNIKLAAARSAAVLAHLATS